MALYAPQPLADHHQISDFTSCVASLDDWLKRRARANQAGGATRTFILNDDQRVVGYYALASGAIAVASATGRLRRNMPEPIPVAVLARLAIDRERHGHGLGRALLRDAALRVMNAADTLGIRGLVTHAISDEAKAFYLALGLTQSPLEPMTLMVTIADLRLNLGVG